MFRTFQICFVALTSLAASAVSAQTGFETRAAAAYVIDYSTRTVLMSKNAETPLPPASMSKLMTLYMLFNALRDQRVTMETEFSVSARAQAIGGSTMFLNTTDRPSVRDLIQGIIVQSGNDACVVVAEGLAGTEDNFARQMNTMAAKLGMTQSVFANASGWPDPNHRMSTRDLGILADRLIREFPEYYGYFAQVEYLYKERAPENRFNRNPLLRLNIGADGLKTGHTQEAGYGLVGSAMQGNRRIVFVITGLDSRAARAEEAERIINWGFRQFVEKTVIRKGTRLAHADVWLGNAPDVGLVAAQDLRMVLPALGQDELAAAVEYEGPLRAPIAAGDEVATLVVTAPGLAPVRRPLVAEADIGGGGFATRLRTAARVLLHELAGAAARR
ncbi:MAG: D-alanyl-D-alanine carboxypeptidase family protein [Pseudomonadota bacterium]